MPKKEDAILILRDKRKLGYRMFGDNKKPLLIYLGGLISSRIEPEIFFDERFFIVGVDRPGYGNSDFHMNQTAETLAEDIAELVHNLGRKKCSIFGVSGGGAYAISIASIFPDLIEKIGAFASISPYGTVKTRGFYINYFPFFVKHPWYTWLNMRLRCLLYSLPTFLLRILILLDPTIHPLTKKILTKRCIHTFKTSFREALRPGIQGLISDLKYYLYDWTSEKPCKALTPIIIFHGEDDTTTPLACTEWHGHNLPHCKVRYFQKETHLSVPILHMKEMFDWLAEK